LPKGHIGKQNRGRIARQDRAQYHDTKLGHSTQTQGTAMTHDVNYGGGCCKSDRQ
jgi:hypothetical protein